MLKVGFATGLILLLMFYTHFVNKLNKADTKL